jgi:polyisoprenoid-binding protein YceI
VDARPRLDPVSTSIEFHTTAMWVLPVTGRLRATVGSGTVGSDGTVSGTLVLDAASIDTNNTKRDELLRTADFFEVATFPTTVFTAAGGAPAAGGMVQLTGTFEVHG